MSDLLFCCFQKIFFVFCRIFIGPLRKVAHLTKKINEEIMKNHTRLPPFAHKNTLRKCLHFSLIRVNNWKFWTEPLWVGFQWTKPPQLGSSLSGQKRRYNFSTKNCSKRATEYLSIFYYTKRACVDTKINEGYEHTERYYSQALQVPHSHSNLSLLSFPKGGKFCTEPLWVGFP